MKLIPLLLQGKLSETLKYDFGRVQNITQGTWELSIKSIAFNLHKARAEDKKSPQFIQKTFDQFINVYVNYCEGPIVEDTATALKPYCLSQIHLKLAIKQRRLYPYKTRDFFEVNNAKNSFELFFTDSEGEKLPEEVVKYISVHAHILFRRQK